MSGGNAPFVDQRPCEIYALSDPFSGEVRYVGRSRNARRRYYNHLANATKSGRTAHCYSWIKSILARAGKPSLSVIETCPADDWASRERFWIEFYRKAGHRLTNLNDGGVGPWDVHPETRAKLSAATASRNRARRGQPASAHARAVWSDAQKRRVAAMTPDERREYAARLVRGRKPGWNKLNRTACVHGHPYTPENTYVRTNGLKACRECARLRSRVRR